MGAFRAGISAKLGERGFARTERPPRTGRARGFTLLELSVALFVVASLAAMAGITYATVSGGVQRLAAGPTITLVQLDLRRAISGTVPLAYPETIVDSLVCTPPACPPGVTITAGVSSAPDVVSVYRYDASNVIIAAGSPGGCLVLVDRLAAPPSWVWYPDLNECSAQAVEVDARSVSGGSASDPVRRETS